MLWEFWDSVVQTYVGKMYGKVPTFERFEKLRSVVFVFFFFVLVFWFFFFFHHQPEANHHYSCMRADVGRCEERFLGNL